MKSFGLIHGQLLKLLAELGADDSFVIGHRGVSVSDKQELVDLAIAPGIPSILDVLDIIVPEILTSSVLLPFWVEEKMPDYYVSVMSRMGHTRVRTEQTTRHIESIRHARFVIRTGEELPITFVVRSGFPWNELEESQRTGALPPERMNLEANLEE